MRSLVRRCSLPLVLLAAGCLDGPERTALVPADTFGGGSAALPAVQTKTMHAAATEEAENRVLAAGRKLIQANENLGVRPAFVTLGDPRLEVFHRSTSDIMVTEGLVNRCANEEQLTAVLAFELGRMISEREAAITPRSRRIEREPPMEVRIGSDVAGAGGPADMTRMAELAPYDRDRRNREAPLPVAPDPRALARQYLIKASVAASELDAVEPILYAAGQNATLQRQMTQPAAQR
jgi:hypothetical protein